MIIHLFSPCHNTLFHFKLTDWSVCAVILSDCFCWDWGSISVGSRSVKHRILLSVVNSCRQAVIYQQTLLVSDHHITGIQLRISSKLTVYVFILKYCRFSAHCANTSNTWSPGGSVLWIDATKAASIHVSLHTIWPCLSWSPSRSWTCNLHIGDRIDTGWRSDNVSIPSKTLSA